MTLANSPCQVMSQSSVTPALKIVGIGDEIQKEARGYLGAVIRFRDDSCWEVTKALCDTKYQQGEPPFEARRVYECVCVEDPNNTYVEVKYAVLKVKYQ
jgi:hypothetical protein